ncbi:hypothetical protein ACRAWF_16290 [Streptomyces sp. L7]
MKGHGPHRYVFQLYALQTLSTAPRRWTGSAPAPSCPPSPRPSWAAPASPASSNADSGTADPHTQRILGHAFTWQTKPSAPGVTV